MVTVLVTGRMGAGKSKILDFIKSNKGYPIFKADQFARSLLDYQSPCFQDLSQLLGPSFLKNNHSFDRKLLAQELFKDASKLKEVEKITHPFVRKGFKDFAKEQESQGKEIIFYEVPLLSREVLEARFDYIVLVQCPKDLNLERLKKKGFKEEEIYLRWSAQAEEKDVLDLADFTILNNGDLNLLKQKIEKLLIDLKKKIKK